MAKLSFQTKTKLRVWQQECRLGCTKYLEHDDADMIDALRDSITHPTDRDGPLRRVW